MPKPKEITKKLKAVDLSKPYIKSGFNQAKVARERGVTRQAIQEQVHRKPTIDSLQKYLNSPGLKNRLVNVAKDGLTAKSRGLKDHDVRHKFWRDLMIVNGALKNNGNGKGAAVVIIQYGYREQENKNAAR